MLQIPLHKALLFKSINCISRDQVSIPNGSMWILLLFVFRGFTMNARVVLLVLNCSNLSANCCAEVIRVNSFTGV